MQRLLINWKRVAEVNSLSNSNQINSGWRDMLHQLRQNLLINILTLFLRVGIIFPFVGLFPSMHNGWLMLISKLFVAWKNIKLLFRCLENIMLLPVGISGYGGYSRSKLFHREITSLKRQIYFRQTIFLITQNKLSLGIFFFFFAKWTSFSSEQNVSFGLAKQVITLEIHR